MFWLWFLFLFIYFLCFGNGTLIASTPWTLDFDPCSLRMINGRPYSSKVTGTCCIVVVLVWTLLCFQNSYSWKFEKIDFEYWSFCEMVKSLALHWFGDWIDLLKNEKKDVDFCHFLFFFSNCLQNNEKIILFRCLYFIS